MRYAMYCESGHFIEFVDEETGERLEEPPHLAHATPRHADGLAVCGVFKTSQPDKW